jgi:hypothetical protein
MNDHGGNAAEGFVKLLLCCVAIGLGFLVARMLGVI